MQLIIQFLIRIAGSSISGSVAEWTEALVLGTSLFGGVGSNPTAAMFHFSLVSSSILILNAIL